MLLFKPVVGRQQVGNSCKLNNAMSGNCWDPIFVFASSGDNITPPPQALNWIVKVYGSVQEIKRQGQVIVYMVHEDIGHLGIFVSGRVAAKEHNEIIGSLEMVEYLVPGLYEMVIAEKACNPDICEFGVQFEPRDMSDILSMDDGLEDEQAFVPVASISQSNDAVCRQWVQPWVRLAGGVVPAITPPVRSTLRVVRPEPIVLADGRLVRLCPRPSRTG